MRFIERLKSSLTLHEQMFLVAVTLTAIGLLGILSASGLKAFSMVGQVSYFFYKQLVCFLVACFWALWISHRKPTVWKALAAPIFFFSLICLYMIFIPGVYRKVGGAKRWIYLGGLGFQPSDFVKASWMFFISKKLSLPENRLKKLRHLSSYGFFYALIAIPLMKQPDFGSVALLGILTWTMLFLARCHMKWLIFLLVSALGLGLLAVGLAPYRWQRILAFFDPWSSFHTGGFQIIQSYLAFQNGGWGGVGFGKSKQKLFFLPEAHTDFILAVIAEEWGFYGSLLILSLFGFLCFGGLHIASQQKDSFRKLLAYALTLLITFQALINQGVATGLLPTKGMGLPFVSYGLTSLLTFYTILGVLMSLSRPLKTDKESTYPDCDPDHVSSPIPP